MASTSTSEPLYAATHADASVLAVRVPALSDFLLTAPAADQLAWLHRLHVAVDGVLQRVPATKVVMSGGLREGVDGPGMAAIATSDYGR